MKNYNTVKSHFESVLIHHPAIRPEVTLTIDGVRIIASFEDDQYLGFEGISSTKQGVCSHCGQIITRFKQYRTSYITIARYNQKNLVLKLSQKMYHCPDCRSSTTERLLKKSGKYQKTDSFIQGMLTSLKEPISFSAVARFHKLSVTNLIWHFDKAHFPHTQISRETVRNLSVDEVGLIKFKDANYQFVIMDSDTKQILDILKTRQVREVQDYLGTHYTGIQTFTQDLWKPYRRAAYDLFPETKVLTDRFHVVRQFSWAFARSRIELARRQQKRTCGNWKLLTKARHKLDARGQARLEALLADNKELSILHQAKEMALELFRCRDSSSYLSLLPAFKEYIDLAELPEFQKAYRSLENWHTEIINMFDHPYSNGAMERANRTIKQAKNIAFGFKNLSRATRLIQYRVN